MRNYVRDEDNSRSLGQLITNSQFELADFEGMRPVRLTPGRGFRNFLGGGSGVTTVISKGVVMGQR
jgi:hypothetical protein